MSRWDGTNFQKVASREPDGNWACCLCDGWKNRPPDHADYRFSEDEIREHMEIDHMIPIDVLTQLFVKRFPAGD